MFHIYCITTITGYAATEEPTLGYNNKISIEGNQVEETLLGKDGIYTVNYLNGNSVVASTTGNYSGIYDMNGGSWDYVAGYMPTDDYTNMGLIPTDYDDKYFDVYLLDSNQERNNRILGDAVGEMGPFENIVTVVGVKSISS